MKNIKKIPTLRFSKFSGEWDIKTVSQFLKPFVNQVKVNKDKLYKQIGIRSHGKGIFHKDLVSGDDLGEKRVFWIKKNMFVVNIVFAWEQAIAKTTIEEEGMIASHRFPMYESKDNLCNIDYLLYFFLTDKGKNLLGIASPGGAGRNKTLGKAEFNRLKIPLPILEEQQKIADFFTQIDNRIEKLTKKKQFLEKYKKGVMQKIFNQEIRFKDNNGEDYHDWEVKKLGEIAKFRRGSFPQPYGLEKWYDDVNGMPFIQVFDVNDNFLLKDKTKRKISKEAQLQSVFVEIGSILITIQGSIGRIAITQYPAYVDRTLLLFESFKININKYYFSYVLFLLFEIEKEKAPGGTIKTITKEVLTNFEVFICDYEEQTKIANFLTEIDRKINFTEKQLNGTKKYKKGLLQQMFI